MDFSESMHSIVKECFPYATIIIDRFHVQKDCYESMQQLRVRHRREAQRSKGGRLDGRGRKPNRKNGKYESPRLANGDTVCQILARSRYLLMTSSEKWTGSQKTRARILFDLYPDMKTAYGLAHSLRMIFSNPKATKKSGKKSQKLWYNKVTEFDDDNFYTVSVTIYEREDEILTISSIVLPMHQLNPSTLK